ncbi:MAG TPA: hypothetical protein VNN73_01850 [Blastocatellia bacterium]|nr:hypothetical protein [Blastocatellia bacterium]
MRVKNSALIWLSLSLFLLLNVGTARAQDPFEIQVYEYETVPKGKWNLETHLNFIGKGTKEFEGTVAPSRHQFHLTFELTRGITDHFEMAGYLVLARRPDGGLEYAGWRVRPRVSLPQSWRLPVDVSLSGEVGFPRKVYEENSVTLELRPIIEKRIGRFQFDINPTIGRALKGPGKDEGWDFEPGVRVGYEATKRLDLSLEYYGSTGPLSDPLPAREQVHQFYPGGDFKLAENVVWNFGVGLGVTASGNRLVYKSRIGILF